MAQAALAASLLSGCTVAVPPTPIVIYVTPSPAGTATPPPAVTATPTSARTDGPPPSAAPIVFTGSGDRVSKPFELSAGDYQLGWKAIDKDGDGCTFAMKVEPIGSDELLFVTQLEFLERQEGKDGQMLFEVDGGRYAIGVESGCEWAVTISAID